MSSPASRQEPPVLELQLHPGSVRWGVRIFLLRRKQLRILGLVLVLLTGFTVAGLAVVPSAIAGLFRAREYRTLLAERELQGERAQSLGLELASLKGETDELRRRMDRIYLTYGMTTRESAGQGGFEYEQGASVESIYAGVVDSGRLLQREVSEALAVLGTFLEEVETFEEAHRDQVQTTPSISPLAPESFVLTSPFGHRRSPFTKKIDAHAGLDLAAPTGTPIMAPADGVVVFAGRYPVRRSVAWWRYGNLVAIRHGEQFITLFGHCDEVLVHTGQRVEQRQVIATVGDTGWSTNPHLHYEVRVRTEEGEFGPVDPRVYMLDHRWRDEEELLIQARNAPSLSGYEPLPRIIGR